MSTHPTTMIRCVHCDGEWQPEYRHKVYRSPNGWRCADRVRCHRRLLVAQRIRNLHPIRPDAYHPQT